MLISASDRSSKSNPGPMGGTKAGITRCGHPASLPEKVMTFFSHRPTDTVITLTLFAFPGDRL